MVQKVHPKGPRVLPPKCEFQKMRSGECSVHILRGPCLDLQSKLIGPHLKFWLIQRPFQSLYQKRLKTENCPGYTGEPPSGATGPWLFLNCFELTASHFQDHILTQKIHPRLSQMKLSSTKCVSIICPIDSLQCVETRSRDTFEFSYIIYISQHLKWNCLRQL